MELPRKPGDTARPKIAEHGVTDLINAPCRLYTFWYSESDMINQSKETNAALLQRHYLQAAGLFHAQNQQVHSLFLVATNTNCLIPIQYAQICSAVQQQSIKDYHQLQYLAERQRHQELEQIKTKERNQVRQRHNFTRVSWWLHHYRNRQTHREQWNNVFKRWSWPDSWNQAIKAIQLPSQTTGTRAVPSSRFAKQVKPVADRVNVRQE